MNDIPKEIIDKLKNTQLFTGNSDMARLTGKQSILLVLSGDKLVSEVTTGKWAQTESGRKSVPEDEAVVSEFLSSLGLCFNIRNDEYATDAIISLNLKYLDQYIAGDASVAGWLFGYPETAVVAFGRDNELLDNQAQDEIMEKEGIPANMPMFRMSKLNYKNEIEVLRRWFSTIQKYGFDT